MLFIGLIAGLAIALLLALLIAPAFTRRAPAPEPRTSSPSPAAEPPRCILCRASLETRPVSAAAAVSELERRIRRETAAIDRLLEHVTPESVMALYLPSAMQEP